MRQLGNPPWWVLIIALLIVAAWPSREDKSLAAKFVNWAVDPWDELPVLPPQLSLGQSHDPDVISERDLQAQHYYAVYLEGGWTRRRLELKVAGDPFDPSTERQVLALLAVVVAFLALRLGARKGPP